MSGTITKTGVTLRLQLQREQDMQESTRAKTQQRKSSFSLTTQEQMAQAIEKLTSSIAEITEGLKKVSEDVKQTQSSVNSVNSTVNSATEKLQAEIKESSQRLETSIGQIEQNVRKNREEINKVAQEVTVLKKETEEIKVVKEKIRTVEQKLDNIDLENIEKIGSRQRSVEESLAFLQLQQGEGNLRLRGLPELEEGSLKDFIVTQFSTFWHLKEDEVSALIVKAFRFGTKGKKSSKTVSDCLIVLNNRYQRDYILDLHYKNNLVVQQNRVVLFKDIPKFFLDKRAPYNDLTAELRRRNISFSWEFPEGLTFMFKEKRIRIRSPADKQKFLDKHLEDFKGSALDPAYMYRLPGVFPPPGIPGELPPPGTGDSRDSEKDKKDLATGGSD